jgi:hypothetical protein
MFFRTFPQIHTLLSAYECHQSINPRNLAEMPKNVFHEGLQFSGNAPLAYSPVVLAIRDYGRAPKHCVAP